ncbi:MAG TPA: hypothetical protein VFR31_17000, partial [Thermoanaerobaculia bacterium]|nr:hypothetical protein [Thermoanaerobaculia bacterium]
APPLVGGGRPPSASRGEARRLSRRASFVRETMMTVRAFPPGAAALAGRRGRVSTVAPAKRGAAGSRLENLRLTSHRQAS